MQYRLGAHGFMFMGKKSSAPGNAGLLDQVNQQITSLNFFSLCKKNRQSLIVSQVKQRTSTSEELEHLATLS